MSIPFNGVRSQMASRISSQKGAKKGSAEHTDQPADSCHVSLGWNSGCNLHPMEKLHVRGLDHLQSVLDHLKNLPIRWGNIIYRMGQIIEMNYSKSWHMNHVLTKEIELPRL